MKVWRHLLTCLCQGVSPLSGTDWRCIRRWCRWSSQRSTHARFFINKFLLDFLLSHPNIYVYMHLHGRLYVWLLLQQILRWFTCTTVVLFYFYYKTRFSHTHGTENIGENTSKSVTASKLFFGKLHLQKGCSNAANSSFGNIYALR